MQNLVTLEAVTHTHTHTHNTFLQNKENLINKIRVGVNSTLLEVYKNKKENIMLGN